MAEEGGNRAVSVQTMSVRTMDVRTMTLEQIRLVGLEALTRELGPAGMVRFLQQFETGNVPGQNLL